MINKKSVIIMIAVGILAVGAAVALLLLSRPDTQTVPQSGGSTTALTEQSSNDTTADNSATGAVIPGNTTGTAGVGEEEKSPTVSGMAGNSDYRPGSYGESDSTVSTQGSGQTATKPSVPQTQPTSPGSASTEPTAPDSSETKPSVTPTTPSQDGAVKQLTWEQYDALNAEEQLVYMNSFSSPAEFVKWFNAAKAEAGEDSIIIGGDGAIDLSTKPQP